MTNPTSIDATQAARAAAQEFRLLGARCLMRLDAFSAGIQYQLHFRNCGERNAEGVFTFSLGAQAQFHQITVRHEDGSWQRSKIVSREQAEDTYERQIKRGKTPLSVVRSDSDLVTVNIGTLKPGEKVDVRLGLAVLMEINAGIASVRVPTSIVPRYGNPAADGLEPLEAPATDPLAEQPFDVLALLDSGFRGSDIAGCTYDLQEAPPADINADEWLDAPMEAGRECGKVTVLLGNGKAMASAQTVQFDRTFELRLKNFAAKCWVSLVDNPCTQGSVAYLNYYMDGAAPKQTPNFHVLVDCSGSMSGDGKALVVQCLRDLAKHLPQETVIGLSCFGSGYREIIPFGEGDLGEMTRRLRSLPVGEMGGTELGKALRHILVDLDEQNADILLLTDGAVHEEAKIVKSLRKGNRRVFCIGIGSAPHESLVQEIADATGGKCDFISQHSERSSGETLKEFAHILGCQQLQVEDIQWQWNTDWQSKTPLIVHDRTVARGFAFISTPKEKLQGKAVRLKLRATDGSKPRIVEVPVIASQDAAASAAIVTSAAMARYLTIKDDEEREEFALTYGLFTSETSFILEQIRADGEPVKSQAIVQAHGMLPAGSHGFGSGMDSFAAYERALEGPVMHRRKMPRDVDCLHDIDPVTPRVRLFMMESAEGVGGFGRNSLRHPPQRSPIRFLMSWVASPGGDGKLKNCSITMEYFFQRHIAGSGIPEEEFFKLILNILLRKLPELVNMVNVSEQPVDKDVFPEEIWKILNDGFETMTPMRWNFMHPKREIFPRSEGISGTSR